MAMTINTNVVSINAQRNLGLSGGSLSTSMQRLSSGLRVNSAKDDAAGLAIAERMSTQVRGFAVASRNANDGISLAQTAEGALGKVGDMLQRMRELAVQSGNATNSKSDREALNAELVQLRSEVDRVAKTTSFNGSKLLDGGFTGGVFQVGANAGDNITVGALADTRADKLGSSMFGASKVSIATPGNTSANVTITVQGVVNSATVTITGDADRTGEELLGSMVENINAKTADTGVVAFLTKTSSGYDIEYRSTADAAGTNAVATVLMTGAGAPAIAATTVNLAAASQAGIASMDIKTQVGAWESLQRIDNAIDKVNSARADLGAIQTRFEKSIENIDIMQENISAARGRITDADFAKETANLSRTQILQQAGTAMVAQANQLPQNVLKLLQ
ncbi:flagellin [Comamonas aquatica]|uniref:flagellin n=1 Tax=Comamonas aquatica TaxID=225991 RepID=UPI0021B0DB95|nr:flagellin [Comamonas aquatica]